MSKHTPGPWTIREPGYIEAKTRKGHSVYLVGYAYNLEIARACERGEVEANARLIAAAPELLAACEAAKPLLAMWARHAGSPSAGEALGKITAAIAKATGAAP
jgi:hypothetical protein